MQCVLCVLCHKFRTKLLLGFVCCESVVRVLCQCGCFCCEGMSAVWVWAYCEGSDLISCMALLSSRSLGVVTYVL